MHELIVFPNFVGAISGVSVARIGVRKIWATLNNGQVLSFPRKDMPAILPCDNTLAFDIGKALVNHYPNLA